MNLRTNAVTSRQCLAYVVAVFAALITGAISLCFIEQVTDYSSAAYRLAGMEELRWIPDPWMCFVVIIAFIFSAGPKVAVISIIPWLIALNLIKKYDSGGVIAFLLAGAVIGVLVGWAALPLLWFAQYPSYTRIISSWTTWAAFWRDSAFQFAMCLASGLVGGLAYWWLGWPSKLARLENS